MHSLHPSPVTPPAFTAVVAGCASHRRRATPECLIVIDHIVFGVRARRRGKPSRAYWGRRVIACHGEFLGLAGLDPGVRRAHEIGQDDPAGNRPTCGRPPAARGIDSDALSSENCDWGKKASALPMISAMALVRASRVGRLVAHWCHENACHSRQFWRKFLGLRSGARDLPFR